ncbi:MAG TPA: ubiquinol-cytochrome c reductase iron-sulfur subunit [Candidatus Nitrosopolaris sp.]|nr:ubiquinol-cytochrome c reductase iron-sulfur subunit [Candidatus Nitrosopolaris sp.]
MQIDRRTFLCLSATLAAGCAAPGGANYSGGGRIRIVNAGPAAQFSADGVYTRFRDLGFFIVRRGPNLFALSAICTHRRCKLEAEPDKTFHCPCHGSTFDANGHVTGGPARSDLPLLATSIDENSQLLVTVPAR